MAEAEKREGSSMERAMASIDEREGTPSSDTTEKELKRLLELLGEQLKIINSIIESLRDRG